MKKQTGFKRTKYVRINNSTAKLRLVNSTMDLITKSEQTM